MKYLNEKGVVPDAIDLDPKKIEVLRGEQELRANFIAGDATEILRNRMDQYDCAFMHFVLEHIRPDQVLDLLEAVQRSLRMGGRLCVTVPNMENPLNLRLRYMEPTHRTGFTTESLIWFFYRAGFDRILCKDPSRYDSQKRRRIEKLFGFLSRLLEIRPFHGKFSETLFCQGTKLYPLEALEFGPYDA